MDAKRASISASSKVSSLTDIAIFTNDGEIAFKEVLKKIKETENGGVAINQKSEDKELKKYFEKILPEYDRERVYTSDIKKVITWYNQLQGLNLLDIVDKEEAPAEENAPVKEEEAK